MWQHLSADEYRAAVADLLDHILEEFEEERMKAPDEPARSLVHPPTYRPATTKSSPKPVCHAATREERQRFKQRRRDFVDAYLAASAQLLAGIKDAINAFPKGAFLPPLGLLRFADRKPQLAPSPA